METRIGQVLQDARRRREVDLAEVEAATRIRPRYLRAIEEEEWGALPGGFYTRGFIRAYASFLGLDGDRLAEDYRENVEGASREWTSVPEMAEAESWEPTRPRGLRRRRGVPAAGFLAGVAAVAIAAVVIVALPTGGDGGGEAQTGSGKQASPESSEATQVTEQNRPSPAGVSIRLAAGAEVWVCLLDGGGRPLVDGQILEGGAETGPFRSGSFTVSFGNGEISMLIDGKEAQIPPTSSPIGYSVGASGELTELSEAERPTCT